MPSGAPAAVSKLLFLLLLVLALLHTVDSQNSVSGRSGHSTVLIDKQLWFVNGLGEQTTLLPQVISLNLVSSTFTNLQPDLVLRTTNPSFASYASQCRPLTSSSFRCIGGLDTSRLLPATLTDTVYDTNTKSWKQTDPPAINAPSSRYAHQMVYYKDAYYMYGGSTEIPSDALGLGLVKPSDSRLWKLDLKVHPNTWSKLNPAGDLPPSLSQHTLTAIRGTPNLLVALGGVLETGNLLPMNIVYVYDVDSNIWTKYDVDGDIPASRRGHAATSASNSLYIHGGIDELSTILYADLRVLIYDSGSSNSLFTWQSISTPNVEDFNAADNSIPTGRAFHQLTYIDSPAMLIASFGMVSIRRRGNSSNGLTFDATGNNAQPDYLPYFYSLNNQRWVNRFEGQSAVTVYDVPTVKANLPQKEQMSLLLIITISIASVVVFGIIIGVVCYLRVRKQRNRRAFLRMSGFIPTTYVKRNSNSNLMMSGPHPSSSQFIGPDDPERTFNSPDDYITPLSPFDQRNLQPGSHHAQTEMGITPSAPPMTSANIGPNMIAPRFSQPNGMNGIPGNLNILYMGPAQMRPPVIATRPVIPIVQLPSTNVAPSARSPIFSSRPFTNDSSSPSYLQHPQQQQTPESDVKLSTHIDNNQNSWPMGLSPPLLPALSSAVNNVSAHDMPSTPPRSLALPIHPSNLRRFSPSAGLSYSMPLGNPTSHETSPPIFTHLTQSTSTINHIPHEYGQNIRTHLTVHTQSSTDDGVEFASGSRRPSGDSTRTGPHGFVDSYGYANSLRSFEPGVQFAGDHMDELTTVDDEEDQYNHGTRLNRSAFVSYPT